MKRRIFTFLLIGLLVSGALLVPALAQEEAAHTFEEPEDNIVVWASRACIVVSLLGIGLLVWLLFFRRDRLMEAQSKWLLFLGAVMLPIPVAFLNGGMGMEGSKTNEFCASCHEPMHPFVDNMMDPESEHLAAMHYKNRYMQHEHCWNCHSDYGITGTAEAKMTGLIHIYKYTVDNWEAPIKLYRGTFNWDICLQCHAASLAYQELHEGVTEEVVAGEVGCTDCHETSHPPREERSTRE